MPGKTLAAEDPFHLAAGVCSAPWLTKTKEGVIAGQVMLGVAQTADGLPLHHKVFGGNATEVIEHAALRARMVANCQKMLVRYGENQ